jgi:quinol monooxygenase YgiN
MAAGRYSQDTARRSPRPLRQRESRGGGVHSAGIWIVKEGRGEEFERRWQESVDATSLDYPEVTFKLFRDRDDRRRYISIGEGWRNAEQFQTARESPGFQDSLASIWNVLESGDMTTLDLVLEVS